MPRIIVVLLAAALVILVLVVGEVLHQRKGVSGEITRRAAHICSAVLAASLPLVMGPGGILALAIAFAVAMAVSKQFDLLPSVHGVRRDTAGEVYFPLGIILLLATRPRAPFYVFGILVMGLGDAAASWVGQRWGRHWLAIARGRKTAEGSAALFVIVVIIGVWVLHVRSVATGRAVLGAVVAGLVMALIEGLLGRGLDNLVLPAAGSLVLTLLAELLT